MNTLSPTKLGNYETCLRRGWYYDQKTEVGPPSLGLVIGGVWHQLIEWYHLADALPDNWPQVLLTKAVALLTEADEAGIAYEDGQELMDAHVTLTAMINAFASDPNLRWEGGESTVVGVEVRVPCDFGSPDRMFDGAIDLVVLRPDGDFIGVDHKTASRRWGGAKREGDPRMLVQAPLYAEAFERITNGEMNWFAYDVMTYTGIFDRVWVDTSTAARAPFLTRWHAVASLAEYYSTFVGDPETVPILPPTNPSSFLCSPRYCSYWEICEAGAALDLTLRR